MPQLPSDMPQNDMRRGVATFSDFPQKREGGREGGWNACVDRVPRVGKQDSPQVRGEGVKGEGVA